MPDSAKSSPIFYTNKEKEELKGTFIYEYFREYHQPNFKDYARIVEGIPEFKRYISEYEFIKTVILVQTRIYGYEYDQEISALVPLADMFNHSNESQILYAYNDVLNGFCV